MGSDKVWKDLMELSVKCGMNQRYDQYMLTNATEWSKRIDTVVVVATMLSLMACVAAYFAPKTTFPVFGIPWWKRWTCVYKVPFDQLAVFSSFLAAIAGIVLIISPAGEDAHHFNSMFQGWSDLRQDVDSTIVDADSEIPGGEKSEQAYLERRYRDLLAKKNALNSREPAPDPTLLDDFQTLEEKSREPKDESTPAKQAAGERRAIAPDVIARDK